MEAIRPTLDFMVPCGTFRHLCEFFSVYMTPYEQKETIKTKQEKKIVKLTQPRYSCFTHSKGHLRLVRYLNKSNLNKF